MRVYELATYQQLKLILENETALVVVYVGSDNFPQGAAQYEIYSNVASRITGSLEPNSRSIIFTYHVLEERSPQSGEIQQELHVGAIPVVLMMRGDSARVRRLAEITENNLMRCLQRHSQWSDEL